MWKSDRYNGATNTRENMDKFSTFTQLGIEQGTSDMTTRRKPVCMLSAVNFKLNFAQRFERTTHHLKGCRSIN